MATNNLKTSVLKANEELAVRCCTGTALRSEERRAVPVI